MSLRVDLEGGGVGVGGAISMGFSYQRPKLEIPKSASDAIRR